MFQAWTTMPEFQHPSCPWPICCFGLFAWGSSHFGWPLHSLPYLISQTLKVWNLYIYTYIDPRSTTPMFVNMLSMECLPRSLKTQNFDWHDYQIAWCPSYLWIHSWPQQFVVHVHITPIPIWIHMVLVPYGPGISWGWSSRWKSFQEMVVGWMLQDPAPFFSIRRILGSPSTPEHG